MPKELVKGMTRAEAAEVKEYWLAEQEAKTQTKEIFQLTRSIEGEIFWGFVEVFERLGAKTVAIKLAHKAVDALPFNAALDSESTTV